MKKSYFGPASFLDLKYLNFSKRGYIIDPPESSFGPPLIY